MKPKTVAHTFRIERAPVVTFNPDALMHLLGIRNRAERAERNAKAEANLAPMVGHIMLALTDQVPAAGRDNGLMEMGRAMARCAPRRHNAALFMLSVLVRGLKDNLDALQLGAEGHKALDDILARLDDGVFTGDDAAMQVGAQNFAR